MENPEDPGEEPFPSVFRAPPVCALREQWAATDVCFDQCEFGLDFIKPTQVLSSSAVFQRLRRRCSHGPNAHKAMLGKDAQGAFVTTAQSRYPPRLCEALAACVVDVVAAVVAADEAPPGGKLEEGRQGVGAEEADEQWRMKRVPSIGTCWDPLERWKETFRVRWRTSEHNNIGELRTVILALRHVNRSNRAWDSRILMITDSLVSLGVLAKGRTSSWPLLRLARQGAALTMAFGFRVYYRYVESKRNYADGPSRGFPLGVAPAWVGALERRKEIQRALQRRYTASC